MVIYSSALLFLLLHIASCKQEIDLSKHVEDFLDDLGTPEKNQHDHHAHQSKPDAHHDHQSSMQHGHDHSGHMMMMWFHGGYNEVILFDFWRINSLQGLILSCIGIFFMGAIYEGLKWFRVFLQIQQSRKAARHPQDNDIHAAAPFFSSQKNSNMSKLSSALSISRLTQGLLYIVQLILAYWLMLIVMTYNTWLSIAVVLGAGFGHWIFAVLKLESPDGQAADSFATDACH